MSSPKTENRTGRTCLSARRWAQQGVGATPTPCCAHRRAERHVRPVLFSVFGLDIQSYGASKALAALVAAFMLARAFEQRGLKRDSAYSLVMWATIWGFVGAKIYYLLEQLPNFDVHHLGGMGFTWYGGLIG